MVSWGHYNHDMAACAAPIFKQSNGKMVAVLSVSCPITTYDEKTFKEDIAALVIATADKISIYLLKSDVKSLFNTLISSIKNYA